MNQRTKKSGHRGHWPTEWAAAPTGQGDASRDDIALMAQGRRGSSNKDECPAASRLEELAFAGKLSFRPGLTWM